jgi:hypothetical protein
MVQSLVPPKHPLKKYICKYILSLFLADRTINLTVINVVITTLMWYYYIFKIMICLYVKDNENNFNFKNYVCGISN